MTEEGVVAVQDFNLTIRSTRVCGAVGPSKVGKSTTLRMIAGLGRTYFCWRAISMEIC